MPTTKKPLTQKQITNRLQKKVNQLFTKDEQEHIQFYPDVDKPNYYSWIIKHKKGKIELACDKRTGIITTCGL